MRYPSRDWEFNTLGIYNYQRPGKLSRLFKFIRENDAVKSGDIVEAGVFRGAQTLALGLFLKSIGSTKKVYAFDSFKGFPPIYSKHDHIDEFQRLHAEGVISGDHYDQVCLNIELKRLLDLDTLAASNISESGDFSSNSLDLLQKKILILGLDNIILVDGTFSQTMTVDTLPTKVIAGIVDCDLYESYVTALNFLAPRLVEDALIFLDEYYSLKFPGARIATDDFIAKHQGFALHLEVQEPGDFERWYLRRSALGSGKYNGVLESGETKNQYLDRVRLDRVKQRISNLNED